MATHYRLGIVVAAAENGVIGRNGALPWRLRSDLARFRRLTLGKPVIMGRKTLESLGKPLPGRDNVVITRQAGFAMPGVTVAATLDDAIRAASAAADRSGATEIMVIGGAEIYAAAISRADRLYLTRVHGRPAGDTYLTEIEPHRWQVVASEFHAAESGEAYSWTLFTMDRR